MTDKPWWTYAAEFVILICGIAILVMAAAYASRGGGALEWSVNPLTVGIGLAAVILLGTLVAIARWSRRRNLDLWLLLLDIF